MFPFNNDNLTTDDKKTRKRGSMYMVTPYMDHDLAGLLENPHVRLKVPHIKSYMKQLLKGTAYLHEVSTLFFLISMSLMQIDENPTSRYESR